MIFDHLAVAGATLEEATAHVEEALGVALQPGGAHAVFHTHNNLLGLADGLYLEAIAINPAAPTPTRPRWFDLDRFEGPARLTNWICACDDIEALRAALPQETGAPVDLMRGDLRWRMAVPQTGILPYDNCWPALIEWQTASHPATRLNDKGVGLRHLIVSHPQADQLRADLAAFLNDGRVSFEVGAPGLSAEFDTPHGRRSL